MNLTLVHIHREVSADKYVWTPFVPDDEFSADWWNSPPYLLEDPHYVRFNLDGVEVARVELDHHFDGCGHLDAPDLGDAALEVQFMEVAKSHRRQGIGALAIAELAREFPDRRLLAFSEEADKFWSSLGWERYDHADGPQFCRPLFVQPAASA